MIAFTCELVVVFEAVDGGKQRASLTILATIHVSRFGAGYLRDTRLARGGVKRAVMLDIFGLDCVLGDSLGALV